MGVVCPQDVKKMLLKQASMVCWKRWAAKHEWEELKEGVWLEPIQAMLRRKTNESWKDKHRICDEEVGRGSRMGAEENVRDWVVGRTDVSGHGEAQTVPLTVMERSQKNQMSEGLGKWEQRATNSPNFQDDCSCVFFFTSFTISKNFWAVVYSGKNTTSITTKIVHNLTHEHTEDTS